MKNNLALASSSYMRDSSVIYFSLSEKILKFCRRQVFGISVVYRDRGCRLDVQCWILSIFNWILSELNCSNIQFEKVSLLFILNNSSLFQIVNLKSEYVCTVHPFVGKEFSFGLSGLTIKILHYFHSVEIYFSILLVNGNMYSKTIREASFTLLSGALAISIYLVLIFKTKLF